MTIFVAPAPAPVADAGVPVPNLEVNLDRGGASFGPALAEARAQLDTRATGRRDQPADDSPRTDDRPTQRSRPSTGRDERVQNDERPTDDAADQPSEDEVAGDEGAVATETPDTEVDEAVGAEQALLGVVVLPSDHPTAKGADGDGPSSTDPTVEDVAAPTLPVVEDTDATETEPVDDGSSADADAVPRLADGAALTGLDAVVDTDLQLAPRIAPTADVEEVAGPSIETTSDRAAASEAVQGQMTEGESDTRRVAVADDVDPGFVADTGEALPSPDATGEQAEPTVVRDVGTNTVQTAARADRADAVVVMANEAVGIAADSSRPAAAAAAPTPTQLASAEGDLWQDVRAAFDRIRTAADGNEVKIRLHPAELGELVVQVRTQGDHISVKLVTSTAAAHQALVDDRLRLAAELTRAGFDEGSVDIGQSMGDDRHQRGDEEDRPDRGNGGPIGTVDTLATAREIFERRDPISHDSGFRPGRSALSTINLTL